MTPQQPQSSGSNDAERDADLLIRVANRDRAAFAAFFDLYARRIKAFVMRWGTAEQDADEIAQEVMVQVWRKAGQYDPARASAATWVFTIARNKRIDRLRKIARAEPDPNDPLFQPDPEPDGAAALSLRERDARMRAALAALNPDQITVVRASFYDGLSHGEIATALDIPLGTVKSRLRLAFSALKAELGPLMKEELFDE